MKIKAQIDRMVGENNRIKASKIFMRLQKQYGQNLRSGV